MVHSTDRQQHYYHGKSPPKLKEGQRVLLDNPTKGKLDPCWTGPWIVIQHKDPTTVLLKMGSRKQTVHINRVRPLLEENKETNISPQWSPPLFHSNLDESIDSTGELLILHLFQLREVAVPFAQLITMGIDLNFDLMHTLRNL